MALFYRVSLFAHHFIRYNILFIFIVRHSYYVNRIKILSPLRQLLTTQTNKPINLNHIPEAYNYTNYVY